MSADFTSDAAFEALQQFADVWHDRYAKSASVGENRKPPSLTMRAGGVAAVLTEPRLQAVVAEYARMRNEWVSDMHAAFAAGLEASRPAEAEQRWQLGQGWIADRVAERQAMRNGGDTP